MDFQISGKHALVGGGSKGLGLASAVALAREGCTISLVSRSMDNLASALDAFPDGSQVHLVDADLSTADGRKACLESARATGPIDILVNNTGGPPAGGSLVHDGNAWQKACDQLLYYVRDMCEGVLPDMKKSGWGRVITITSITVKEPSPMLVLSNVFRAAVTSYLKGLSLEVAAQGITVNTVLPAAFKTARYDELLEAASARTGKSVEELAEEVAARSPQNRFQKPEELGSLVAFLASGPSSGINGSAIAVDGGTLRGLF